VSASDRSLLLALSVAAFLAWLGVAAVLTSVHPEANPIGQSIGALIIGVAVALTAWPLLWTLGRGAQRHSDGAWTAAGRRALLIGIVVSVVVLLRAIDALAMPLLAFLLGTAVLVELAFILRARATR
jgi:hypothetical protein